MFSMFPQVFSEFSNICLTSSVHGEAMGLLFSQFGNSILSNILFLDCERQRKHRFQRNKCQILDKQSVNIHRKLQNP